MGDTVGRLGLGMKEGWKMSCGTGKGRKAAAATAAARASFCGREPNNNGNLVRYMDQPTGRQ